MLFLRGLFILIFGALLLIVVMHVVNAPTVHRDDVAMAVLFAVIVLVLGPLWPSSKKISNSSLRLPTDDPKIAVSALMAFFSVVSLYFAVDVALGGNPSTGRISSALYDLFGKVGVIVFWVVLGIYLAFSAYRAFLIRKPRL